MCCNYIYVLSEVWFDWNVKSLITIRSLSAMTLGKTLQPCFIQKCKNRNVYEFGLSNCPFYLDLATELFSSIWIIFKMHLYFVIAVKYYSIFLVKLIHIHLLLEKKNIIPVNLIFDLLIWVDIICLFFVFVFLFFLQYDREQKAMGLYQELRQSGRGKLIVCFTSSPCNINHIISIIS